MSHADRADSSGLDGAPTDRPAPAPPRARPRWRRLRRAMLGLALVVVVLVLAHRPLLVGFAYLFRVDDPAPSDALVVLLGGPDHRPAKAIELYRRGLAPTILLAESGRTPVLDVDEALVTRAFLIRGGVPADAVRILPGGPVGSTRDEALRMRDYAATRRLRSLTLVTTSFHTARARWIFRRTLRGRGIAVHVAAVGHPSFSESNWYRTEDGLVRYLEEVIKMAFYLASY